MVNKAEKYKVEDETATACISVKNSLESYTYNLQNLISNEKLSGKFEATDKLKLETAVNETIQWLDGSQEALKEEYKENVRVTHTCLQMKVQ